MVDWCGSADNPHLIATAGMRKKMIFLRLKNLEKTSSGGLRREAAGGLGIEERWSWDRPMIDVMVRQRDAGGKLQYLPQATEEDRGAQPFEKHKLELARSPS